LLNDLLHLGPTGGRTLDRNTRLPGENVEPRLQAWLVALRAFAGAPAGRVGIGEFAAPRLSWGSIPRSRGVGEVWTSPHNLPLHLLAETGLVGAVLVLGSLCALGVAGRPALWDGPGGRVVVDPCRGGIEMIHSLTEFPLWSAHSSG